MEDDKILAALGQLHDDIKELIGLSKANSERVTTLHTRRWRFSIAIMSLILIYLFSPWIYCLVSRLR
jgi:hypothetical protein